MTVLLESVAVVDIAAEWARAEAMGGLLGGTARRPYTWLRRNAGKLLFEWRYGVHTAEFVQLEELGLAHRDRVYYSPANWMTLRRTLPRREVGPDDVFIDLGSGMGRMVLEAAARYPFKKVIGVELSRHLNQIARANVARTRLRLRCDDVRLITCDVLDYVIPDDVNVVFLNNPFQGDVFASTIRNLIDSVERVPRQVRVIYFNPVEEHVLLRTGRFRLLRTVVTGRRKNQQDTGPYGTTRVYLLEPRT
ncbi:class I SAM-dependent methyltransferase [Spongiactinospora sp. TRM90649]|uniref:methyltransferase domain-containing protein n=1 Tax=Spongiactinospora sp. TRM90649 TaxID=3031114 RepID=UPI0023F68E1B|nr:class I SAM-dependent methyltransferase [Spongiactinospora sp. TRM90649]MDF5755020.1 class I SAM-dependent methyltransferase [Spongiactinospora sp. TRM90649]